MLIKYAHREISLLWLPAWRLGPVQKHAAAPSYSLWFQTDGPQDEPETTIQQIMSPNMSQR